MEEVKPEMKLGQNRLKQNIALALGVAFLVGAVAVASSTAGGEEDPLVTKSYLEETVTPALKVEAVSGVDAQLERITAELEAEVAEIRGQLESVGIGGGQYRVVSLSSGQTLSLDLGTQVVLRVGDATVHSGSFPALINLTTGSSLSTGEGLVENNLYVASIADRTITTSREDTKLLVYGGYYVG